MSWPLVPLGEIADIIMGQAPASSSYTTSDRGVSLIAGAGDFVSGRIVTSKNTTQPTRLSQAGDIILSVRASIGDIVWGDRQYCLGRGVAALRPHGNIEPNWLWHQIKLLAPKLRAMGRGATFLQVTRADIGALEVPLPPLPEQRRIATILDQADAIRAQRQQVLDHLDTLTQSIFHDMFGSTITERPNLPLGEVTELKGGRNLVAADTSVPSQYRVLKISSVTSGRFLPTESKPLPGDYKPPSEHFIHQGDLLISRANTSVLVGASAIVREEPDGLVLPDKIWRFDWKVASEPDFYQAFLNTRRVRKVISALATGSGGSMKNISKEKLLQLRIPDVSHREQLRFSRCIRPVRNLQSKALRAQTREAMLQRGLSMRAFAGEL